MATDLTAEDETMGTRNDFYAACMEDTGEKDNCDIEIDFVAYKCADHMTFSKTFSHDTTKPLQKTETATNIGNDSPAFDECSSGNNDATHPKATSVPKAQDPNPVYTQSAANACRTNDESNRTDPSPMYSMNAKTIQEPSIYNAPETPQAPNPVYTAVNANRVHQETDLSPVYAQTAVNSSPLQKPTIYITTELAQEQNSIYTQSYMNVNRSQQETDLSPVYTQPAVNANPVQEPAIYNNTETAQEPNPVYTQSYVNVNRAHQGNNRNPSPMYTPTANAVYVNVNPTQEPTSTPESACETDSSNGNLEDEAGNGQGRDTVVSKTEILPPEAAPSRKSFPLQAGSDGMATPALENVEEGNDRCHGDDDDVKSDAVDENRQTVDTHSDDVDIEPYAVAYSDTDQVASNTSSEAAQTSTATNSRRNATSNLSGCNPSTHEANTSDIAGDNSKNLQRHPNALHPNPASAQNALKPNPIYVPNVHKQAVEQTFKYNAYLLKPIDEISYFLQPTASVFTIGTTAPPFTGTTGMADTTSTPSLDTTVTTGPYSTETTGRADPASTPSVDTTVTTGPCSTETTAMADTTSTLSVETTVTTGPYSTRTTRMTDSLYKSTTQTTVSPAFSSTQGLLIQDSYAINTRSSWQQMAVKVKLLLSSVVTIAPKQQLEKRQQQKNFTKNNFFRKSEHTNNTIPILPDVNEEFKDKLTFWVNGKRHVVQNPDPAMTLNEWLRSQRGLTGTKVMCREGGCGCCVVIVTHSDLTNGGACSYSLNSCLCPLCSVDGWSITTVEGLGGQKGGFHPIQRRLADFNGSQCGYCSPGMVVNMYGLLNKKPQPSQQEVENHFDGHICRCTGYRPILDAMKSFAFDADPEKGGCIDIEDLNKHPCPSAGAVCNGASANGNGVNGTSTSPLRCCQRGVTWCRPTTLAELYGLLERHSQDRYKLVCGNTAAGVYKNDGPYYCLIDIKDVPDLYNRQAGPPLVVGSAVSLSAVVDLLRAGSDRSPSYSMLADHLCKVANVSVRNVIYSLEIPPGNPEDVFRTYKVAPRSQNAHAYVNAGFRMTLDRQSDLKVVTKPYIVFGGINKTMFYLSAVGKESLTEPVRSAADSLARPVSRGEQHFQTKESEWPLRQPMPKTSSRVQEIPGAVAYLTAADVKGENNYNLPPSPVAEIFSSNEVSFAGQPVALVIADTQVHADAMAKAVQVTYTDIKTPILTIQDAITAESFHPIVKEVVKGDPKGALAAAPHRVSGEVSCGSQYHFYMETQVCRCTPTEDGMDVQSATQSMDSVQASVAQATGMSAHRVYVSVKRVGGAFGGKAAASKLPAAACAVAAQNLNRTVRLSMCLDANMAAMSKRAPYLVKYEVGFDDEGRLLAVVYNLYEDNGCSVNTCFLPILPFTAENGFVAVHFCMEHIIEHVAKTLNKDPTDIRRINMFENGQTILSGDTLSDCNIAQLCDDLLTSAKIKQRQQEIEVFNKEHRWKKRGLSVVPLRYAIFTSFFRFTVFVAIYHTDGSVVITHGGIEMGQGVDTKVMQVAAASLGVPMEMIHTMSTNTLSSPNSTDSGGSVTSDLNCKGVLECCRRLNERINPIRQEMGGAPKWTELINTCHSKGVDLSEKYMEHHPLPGLRPTYNSFGVTCTEVELDVLTGEREVTRSDILFDCGESVNPDLDIGQVEGAFVFGLGYWLTEKCVYDKETGRLLTNGTWVKPTQFCGYAVVAAYFLHCKV
uniref:FAD-binding PCMH-type domain-containing protein n=1 Tax=Branchiostoma floridae TaxID=7739 RepID=C3Z421_BRAFL|eukprot:XP_002596622.1 hypothetical protein BRAFLDRAFT_78483 [Branchiostoma floridae]